MMKNTEKTTFSEKLGYGIASMGDAVGYSLIGTFLLFFLTTVAGISPGIAGFITAVGAVWNAAINPLIGYFADKVNTKYGRRRPSDLHLFHTTDADHDTAVYERAAANGYKACILRHITDAVLDQLYRLCGTVSCPGR